MTVRCGKQPSVPRVNLSMFLVDPRQGVAAFNRAFKREFGLRPAGWRKRAASARQAVFAAAVAFMSACCGGQSA